MEQLKTSVTDFGNGIYAIDQQMVRAFLLVGTDSALLLDTGAVKTDITPLIRAITDKPTVVVLTHGDGDHIANLGEFAEAFAGAGDISAIAAHAGCENVALRALDEGQIFDIGARKLRVLFTPGHTAGSVSLLDAENGLLFSGDTVSYGPIFMFGERRDMARYLETLKTLRDMRENGVFSTVYCCHNECPISADAIDDLIGCVSGIIDKTIAGAPAPMPIPTAEPPLLGKFGKCGVLF